MNKYKLAVKDRRQSTSRSTVDAYAEVVENHHQYLAGIIKYSVLVYLETVSKVRAIFSLQLWIMF